MSITLARIKQDFAQNRAKSIVLAVLSLAMGGLVIRTLLNTHPRAATASLVISTDSPQSADDQGLTQAQIDQRLQESRLLWQTLREKRGVAASAAFIFDPAFYVREPGKGASETPTHIIEDSGEKPVVKSSDEQKVAGKIASIREEAQSLTLQSTVMASDPLAVINGEIFRVGQRTHGFRVTAIKARLVTLEKNGTTLTLEMAK